MVHIFQQAKSRPSWEPDWIHSGSEAVLQCIQSFKASVYASYVILPNGIPLRIQLPNSWFSFLQNHVSIHDTIFNFWQRGLILQVQITHKDWRFRHSDLPRSFPQQILLLSLFKLAYLQLHPDFLTKQHHSLNSLFNDILFFLFQQRTQCLIRQYHLIKSMLKRAAASINKEGHWSMKADYHYLKHLKCKYIFVNYNFYFFCYH